jgi:hypothetical protein
VTGSDDRVPPETWFARLGAAVPELDVALDPDEREALLDLARVAAHTSERWTAPVSTFLLGMALAELPPAARGVRLRALLRELAER